MDDNVRERARKRLTQFSRSPFCDSDEGEAYLQDVKSLLELVESGPSPAPAEESEGLEQLEKKLQAAEKAVAQLKHNLAAKQLETDSWRGEVKNLLYDRPKALGAKSREIIHELVAELARRDDAQASA